MKFLEAIYVISQGGGNGWWGMFWPMWLAGLLFAMMFAGAGAGLGWAKGKLFPKGEAKERISRRWWKVSAIVLAVMNVGLIFSINSVFESAKHDLGSHSNLYYRMWKTGLRGYDRAVALGGLFHDGRYQVELRGTGKKEFMRIFPNTFYEVRHPSRWLKPGQTAYVPDYRNSLSENDIMAGWVAVFEDDVLVRLEYVKG